jgi:tripartite-type tricarboxylate transporter receptor subunit TctC
VKTTAVRSSMFGVCPNSCVIDVLFVAMSLGLGAASAIGQSYPIKPIRIIVPTPPAGAADLLARTIAQKLTERLGQPVIIDNRPGASGNIGMELAARAAPDGYTITTGSATNLAINPTLYSKLPYDAIKDFAPISMGALFTHLLVVHPSVPARSIKELIALLKSKQGEPTYASAGAGTPTHLAGAMFASMAGVRMVHVPYKGAVPALSDVLGGHIAVMFPPLPVALPHLESGRLRVLGVTSSTRLASHPDIPTIAESGFPGYEAIAWNGFVAPAATPKEAVARLSAEIATVIKMPDVKQRLSADGSIPMASSPEEFSSFIKTEMARWARVIKASGARVD